MLIKKVGLVIMAFSLLSACDNMPSRHMSGDSGSGYAGEMDPSVLDAHYPPAMFEAQILSDGQRMNATFYRANGADVHPTILLLHGFPGFEKNLDLAQYLRREGWNVLFFHYRGAWGSEGEFSFLNAAADVGAALEYLRSAPKEWRVDATKISIVGHSMGGQMAFSGGSRAPDVACVVGLAASDIVLPAEYRANEELMQGFRDYTDTLTMLRGLNGDNVVANDRAFEQVYTFENVAEGLRGKNVFLYYASNDEAVGLDTLARYEQAFAPHSDIGVLSEVVDDDHSFSVHRIALARSVSEFLNGNCR